MFVFRYSKEIRFYFVRSPKGSYNLQAETDSKLPCTKRCDSQETILEGTVMDRFNRDSLQQSIAHWQVMHR